MRITVDLDTCQGYVCCVVAAPQVFDVDDDSGLALLKDDSPPEELRAKVEQAVRDCPTKAITLHED